MQRVPNKLDEQEPCEIQQGQTDSPATTQARD